jgi:2-oxoglutarate dehydrogenase E2 component (dihydrolipoamide succinyltransferase)
MRIDLKVPNVGESITEVEVGQWFKNKGDSVSKDETLVVVESDKATIDIHAPVSATLIDILKNTGDSAAVGEVIAHLEANTNDGQAATGETKIAQAAAEPPQHNGKDGLGSDGEAPGGAQISPEVEPAGPALAETRASQANGEEAQDEISPSDQDAEIIAAKESAAQQVQDAEAPEELSKRTQEHAQAPQVNDEPLSAKPAAPTAQRDQAVRMTSLRRLIAERLVQAQQNAVLLTTFNEIDMSAVIALRQAQGEAFQEKHRIKLGFMSFFVKAAVIALQTVREVNAEIRGDEIIYHSYYDIGIAVGGGKGLVVPVLRNAETMSFADIERAIDDFARRAKESRLKPEELQGGTFTITNGGVYGSLLSTPIVNPPQSAILGLHAIQDRPVARAGAVVIRPLMYVALTYDHRLIDGREAVLFLKQIKTMIEEPALMLLQF